MKWNNAQQRMLRVIGISDESDESVIEDKVADYLQRCCFDENYSITEDGRVCESILDALAED